MRASLGREISSRRSRRFFSEISEIFPEILQVRKSDRARSVHVTRCPRDYARIVFFFFAPFKTNCFKLSHFIIKQPTIANCELACQ